MPAPDYRTPALTVERFEALDFDVGAFDHGAHVYVAWLYLGSTSLADTVVRYSDTLKRLTRREGLPGKYHETITWFLLALIAERRESGQDATWADFRRDNPDLFGNLGDLLARHYSEARLKSDEARRRFLLPDRSPLDRAA